MNKPLLRLKSYDDSFTVTVGRSSPTFIFGVRNLPEGQGGFPAFILDAQKITTDSDTGDVTLDDSVTYSYGGSDGRDLTNRNTEIPIGRFRFTKADLSLTVTEEEDGTLEYNRDFDVIETSRRVTGSAEYSGSVGQESLGTILPGRDINTGDSVDLVVWEQNLMVTAGGYNNSPTGWTVDLNSPSPVKTKSITSQWTRVNKNSSGRTVKSTSGTHPGYEYYSGTGGSYTPYAGYDTDPYTGWDLPNTQEQMEELSYEMRQLKNRNDLLAGGGTVEGGGSDPTPTDYVKKVTRNSETGEITVEYSDGSTEVIPSSVDDLRIVGSELLVVKGQNVVKRLQLPAGGGGGGLTEEHLIYGLQGVTLNSHPTADGNFANGSQYNGEATPTVSTIQTEKFSIPIRGYSGFPVFRTQMIKAAPYSCVAFIRASKFPMGIELQKDPDNLAFFMVKMKKVIVSSTEAYYTPMNGTYSATVEPLAWVSTNAKARLARWDDGDLWGDFEDMKIVDNITGEPWTGYLDVTLIPTSIFPDSREYITQRDFLSDIYPSLFPPY